MAHITHHPADGLLVLGGGGGNPRLYQLGIYPVLLGVRVSAVAEACGFVLDSGVVLVEALGVYSLRLHVQRLTLGAGGLVGVRRTLVSRHALSFGVALAVVVEVFVHLILPRAVREHLVERAFCQGEVQGAGLVRVEPLELVPRLVHVVDRLLTNSAQHLVTVDHGLVRQVFLLGVQSVELRIAALLEVSHFA